VVLIRGILDRLLAAPGIAHAGIASALPLTRDSGTASFAAEGWPADRRDLATATMVSVTPGYFRALGLRLVAGRLLEDADDERAARTITINEALARVYFPGEDPVGRRIRFVGRSGRVAPNAPWLTIVGVVTDVKEDGLAAAVRPQIYQSLWQVSNLSLAVVAQGTTTVPPAALVQRAVQEADPNLPLYAVRSGADLVATELAQRRFAARLINVFAVTALLLATFGLHGVIAYGIRQRTHEIGVRLALGATAGRVVALVMMQAARLTAVGMAIGIGAVLLAAQLLSTLLFGISPRDPWTLAGVVLTLGTVVGLATLAAARRAAHIDAAVALRQDT
jgi:predicted permease